MNYSNAVVTVKEDVVVDESIFGAPLYAKIMLVKGSKFNEVLARFLADIESDKITGKATARANFLPNCYISEKGGHIRCEAFSKSLITGAVVSHESSLWCNLSVDSKLKYNEDSKMFFAVLDPYVFKLEDSKDLDC